MLKDWISKHLDGFLFGHGYYRLEDLTTRGNCGFCGVAIEAPLLKDWNWGICEECKAGHVIRCETCEHWEVGIPCGSCRHPEGHGMFTNDRSVFHCADKDRCPLQKQKQKLAS